MIKPQHHDNNQEIAAEPSGSTALQMLTLPLFGRRTVQSYQRWFSLSLGIALMVLALSTFMSLQQANRASQQVAATGKALMQSQRLAKSVSQALVGS